ncbi:phosphoinositide-specific phospholipase C [Coprinopsis cinerea AmutBmut pab1-1]|nr:phosphoinositide-specific phospholipase C [Coprinopsis cinerea AmutBmut pab1-1]
MANVEDPLSSGRILRRAPNLHDGALVKELESTHRPSHRRQTSIRASIRRRFEEVRDGVLSRSRSLNGRSIRPAGQHDSTPANAEETPRKVHSRSLSELNCAPPRPVSIVSVSPRATNDFTAHQRTLSTVSERSFMTSTAAPATPRPNTHPDSKESGDMVVPHLLQLGTPMTKVSAKKHKKFVFRLDPDLGQIVWESKKHKIIPIENIKEIRSGRDARYYREQFQLAQEYEDRWLTIVYILDGNYKTIHLIVATRDVFRMWDSTLRQLHAIRQELMSGLGNLEVRQALWEKQYWKGADEEQDQRLTFEEVEKLCKRLNINSSQEDLRRLFQQADVRGRGFLEFDDFRKFVKLLKTRPEIRRLYNKLKGRTLDVFDFSTFEIFMREKQQSELTTDELKGLFSKYTGSQSTMSLDSFTTFLLSPDNSAFLDQHLKIYHDMTRPLPEYFISSSHNTYLVGHQLVGDSTIEGYIRALLHSCRSVEVDIYDGDVEPMIFHGKTLTSKVPLRTVCEAIKKYGFVASPYPIIISAEVHCSVPMQDMIAEIMIEVFGDSLIREPLEGRTKIDVLPSPEELKGKILMKTKNLMLTFNDTSDGDSSSTDPSASSASASETEFFDHIYSVPAEKKVGVHDKHESKGPLAKVGSNVLQRVKSIAKPSTSGPKPLRMHSAPEVPLNSPVVSPTASNQTHRRHSEYDRPKPKMSFALVALLVYTVGVKWRGLNKKEEYAPEHMFSLSENTANKLLKMGMMDLIKHTRTHLVRIYPKGTRVTSTNFLPHRFWASGAQLVAINWQTFDLGYMINHAMFQRNGRSGYVLKPAALRSPNKDELTKKTHHVFQVSIISAQQLPRPKNALGHEMPRSHLNPYVEVSLYVPDWPTLSTPGSTNGGVSRGNSTRLAAAITSPRKKRSGTFSPVAAAFPNPADAIAPLSPIPPVPSSIPGKTISRKTGVVKNNGFNPIWEEKLQLPFECVGDMMDLVFVRFVVKCQDAKEGDEPLAVYCASLGSLGRGYRHLPLHDSQLSQFLFSTLFVRINVLDISPPP